MNFTLFLFIIAFYQSISSSYIEACEPFPIHHNFYNCPDEIIARRTIETSDEIETLGYTICPNQGTWECSTYDCFRESTMDMNGYCLYGQLDHYFCCTHKDIHYVDMWIAPNNVTLPQRREIEYIKYIEDSPSSPDWGLTFYNIDIYGEGPDIWINGTRYPEVYTNGTGILFISVIFRYNEDCYLWIELYINATLVINIKWEDILDLWLNIFVIRQMIENKNIDANEQIFFISAHEMIPSLEQIEYLYSLGPNRTSDVEICEDTVHALCHGSCTVGTVSDTYFTLTIVFGVIFGIQFCLLLGIVLWWFMRKKTNKEGFTELTSF